MQNGLSRLSIALCYLHKHEAIRRQGEKDEKSSECFSACCLLMYTGCPSAQPGKSGICGWEFVKIVLPGSGILRLQASQSKSVADEPLYYTAHLSPRGFVIIANELAALPIVAWSQEADFGETGLPDNLEWFIDGLTQQLMELSS
jgi:hypothetical protein